MVVKYININFTGEFEKRVWKLVSLRMFDEIVDEKLTDVETCEKFSKIMIRDIAKIAKEYYDLAMNVMGIEIFLHMQKDTGIILTRGTTLGKFFLDRKKEYKSHREFLDYCFGLMMFFDKYNGWYD